jgi:hypothetical protein
MLYFSDTHLVEVNRLPPIAVGKQLLLQSPLRCAANVIGPAAWSMCARCHIISYSNRCASGVSADGVILCAARNILEIIFLPLFCGLGDLCQARQGCGISPLQDVTSCSPPSQEAVTQRGL